MTIQDELIVILNQIPAAIEKAFNEAMVLRHPGHGDQKVHGRRGTGQSSDSQESKKSVTSVADLTGQEREALRQYSGDYFAQINNNLRSDGRISEKGEQVKTQVDAITQKSIITKDTTVFRGGEFYDSDSLMDLREDYFSVGNTFIDKGFASTSLDKEQAAGFSGLVAPVVFEVKLPAGSKAIDISSISARPNEQEILLPRGAKFKVTGVEKTGEDITDLWHVQLEVAE